MNYLPLGVTIKRLLGKFFLVVRWKVRGVVLAVLPAPSISTLRDAQRKSEMVRNTAPSGINYTIGDLVSRVFAFSWKGNSWN